MVEVPYSAIAPPFFAEFPSKIQFINLIFSQLEEMKHTAPLPLEVISVDPVPEDVTEVLALINLIFLKVTPETPLETVNICF